MSTIKTTNLQHPSAASPNLTLAADGSVSGGAGLGGLVHIATESFSGVSSVSLDNVFSSTYDNYHIVLTHTSSTSAQTLMRVRTSGGNVNSGYSSRISFFQSVYGTASNTSEFRLGDGGTELSNMVIGLARPYLAEPTSMFSIGNDGPVTSFFAAGGIHSTSSSYDGISVFMSSGTFTGTIRVYGYAN